MQRRDGKYCKYRKQWQLMHVFFFNDTATTEIYTLSLHDALPIYHCNRYASTNDRGSRCECNDRMYRHTNVYCTDGNGCMQRRDGKYCKYRKQWQLMHDNDNKNIERNSTILKSKHFRCTNNDCNRYANTNDRGNQCKCNDRMYR